MIVNPYELIKNSQKMSETLQAELDDNNTSLIKEKISDKNKEPLLDAYIDNRLRSDKPITFLSFIDDLRKLWEAAGKLGKIVRDSPTKDEADYPTITYKLTKRVIDSNYKDIKPRYRTTILHPYLDGEYVELYGQVFHLNIEFSVYSLSAEEADEITMELEEFLQTYAGFFKANGVQEILFQSQESDAILQQGRVLVHNRPLHYTMRFEKIIVRFLNEIQQIAVQARLHNEGKTN